MAKTKGFLFALFRQDKTHPVSFWFKPSYPAILSNIVALGPERYQFYPICAEMIADETAEFRQTRVSLVKLVAYLSLS